MFFGRRKTPSSNGHPGGAQAPQQETRQRLLPAELWDDPEIGDMLRKLGKSPDDEENLIPTGASIDAQVARGRARHEAELAELNRDVAQRTGGGRMLPFFLIPEPCWNGEMGTFFLARLRFFPYDDWNVVFMPADDRTAKMMNKPVCPAPGGTLQDDVVRLVQQLIQEANGKLAAACAEAERTRHFAAVG